MRGKDIGHGMRRLSVNSLLPTDTILFEKKINEEIPKILIGKKLNIWIRKREIGKCSLPKDFKVFGFEGEDVPKFNIFISVHTGFKNNLEIEMDALYDK